MALLYDGGGSCDRVDGSMGGNRGGNDGFGFATMLFACAFLLACGLKGSPTAARRTGGFGRLLVERPLVSGR